MKRNKIVYGRCKYNETNGIVRDRPCEGTKEKKQDGKRKLKTK